MTKESRRNFLKSSITFVGGIALLAPGWLGCSKKKAPASERLQIGMIGTGGQGRSNAEYFMDTGLVDILAVCDVDDAQISKAVERISERQGQAPSTEKDYRTILDDPAIDAVVISTPDHWHAIPTIEACQAGKDVYVEKPLSHTVAEGRAMIQAAREHKRVVQMGAQQRSGQHYRTVLEYVRSGKIGKVAFARGWVTHVRDSVPAQPDGDPPAGVDYDRWLGPAPDRPFNPNRFHYNWRWFWDYGTGELGNWGVHHLDILIAGLDPPPPTAVYSHGGNFGYEDGSETPDTQIVVYEYPDLTIEWEHRIWSDKSFSENRSGAIFYGTEATLEVTRDGWKLFPNDEDEKDLSAGDSEMREAHILNFIDCVKSRENPVGDVEEGNRATVLCHIGNIAYRLKRRLEWNGESETFIGDEEADRYLTKEYREPFILPG